MYMYIQSTCTCIHVHTCFNDNIFNTYSYLHSFYWAFLTVATIHSIEPHKPVNTVEYIVELLGYLSGTIIIAVIISEVCAYTCT